MSDEIHQTVTQISSLYQTLPSPESFRILQLRPGIGAEPLICSLVEAKLSQKPRYEALSYRWTDPDKENPYLVICDGFERPIGPNLYAALIRFRLADVPRALWVDQLCLNQVEGPEKQQQLLIMGDIYSNAERVLAWLGPADDDSDKAMDIFPKLVDHLEELTMDHVHKRMESGNYERNIEDTVSLDQITFQLGLELNSRRALYKLLERPLFSRVWTIQEIALSKDTVIVCGEREFPFAVLERFDIGYRTDCVGYWASAIILLSDLEGENDPRNPKRFIFKHIHVVSVLKQLDLLPYQLSSAKVLNLLRDLDCSEPNDRVYSTLRFLPLTIAQNLTVDLTAGKGKSTETLFTDLATFELTKNHSMDFFSAAGMCRQRKWCPSPKDNQLRPTLTLPTWVPDWTYWSDTHGFWELNNDATWFEANHDFTTWEPETLYKAADSSRGDARLVLLDGTKVLCVQGKILDDVAACMEPFKYPVVYLGLKPEPLFQPVHDMTTVQRKEYWWENQEFDYLISLITDMQLLIDSCIVLAKDCTRYGDEIRRTTACRQTLIGGYIPYRIQPRGTDLRCKAKDEDVNELFTEWDMVLEANDNLIRLPEVLMRVLFLNNGSESDRLFVSRAHEMCARLLNRKWGWTAYEAMFICNGKRFFTTTKGFMGLAPDIAQVGDKVCLISGCCTPFIIRADGPNFRLVGESYVHGVMDGELMSDITFEDINLV